MMALPAINNNNQQSIDTPASVKEGINNTLLALWENGDDEQRAVVESVGRQLEFLYAGLSAGIDALKSQRDEIHAELYGTLKALEAAEEGDYFELSKLVRMHVYRDLVPGIMRAENITRAEAQKRVDVYMNWQAFRD